LSPNLRVLAAADFQILDIKYIDRGTLKGEVSLCG